MSKELSPTIAADLAFNVYSANSGDELALQTFMRARVFAQGGGKTLLKAEVGGKTEKLDTTDFQYDMERPYCLL